MLLRLLPHLILFYTCMLIQLYFPFISSLMSLCISAHLFSIGNIEPPFNPRYTAVVLIRGLTWYSYSE